MPVAAAAAAAGAAAGKQSRRRQACGGASLKSRVERSQAGCLKRKATGYCYVSSSWLITQQRAAAAAAAAQVAAASGVLATHSVHPHTSCPASRTTSANKQKQKQQQQQQRRGIAALTAHDARAVAHHAGLVQRGLAVGQHEVPILHGPIHNLHTCTNGGKKSTMHSLHDNGPVHNLHRRMGYHIKVAHVQWKQQQQWTSLQPNPVRTRPPPYWPPPAVPLARARCGAPPPEPPRPPSSCLATCSRLCRRR